MLQPNRFHYDILQIGGKVVPIESILYHNWWTSILENMYKHLSRSCTYRVQSSHYGICYQQLRHQYLAVVQDWAMYISRFFHLYLRSMASHHYRLLLCKFHHCPACTNNLVRPFCGCQGHPRKDIVLKRRRKTKLDWKNKYGRTILKHFLGLT